MKFLLLTTLLVLRHVSGQSKKDEAGLLKNLTSDYNVYVRPVESADQAVNIRLSLTLMQILHLDETQETLHTLVWLGKSWIDDSFRWDPKEYGGIRSIAVPSHTIWKPDIIMYNSVADKYEYAVDTLAVVGSDGGVSWIPVTHLHSSCSLDLAKFPFDTQNCALKFGSWVYDASKVNLTLEGQPIILDIYATNPEWDLVITKAFRRAFQYPCCPEEYVDITFTLQLKRKSTKYAHTVLAPSVILALTIPFIFMLPPGSPEKTTLGTGVLIGLVLLTLMLQDMLPPGGQSVAALALYNLSCIALTAFSLIFASMVNTVRYKTGNVPDIISKIFLTGIGRVLCVSMDTYYKMPFEPSLISQAEAGQKDDAGSASRSAPGEWQLLAMVFDRILLIVFLLVVIITTIVMFS